jgi:Raf kinase inhibitor-like YbhB/YbcL family protein
LASAQWSRCRERAKHDPDQRGDQGRRHHRQRAGVQGLWLHRWQPLAKPELERAPSATKSFAVSIYDPDAPTGSGWWHWVVFNLPAATTSLPKGAGDVKKKLMPKGAIQSRTDFGADGYGGPCPPAGDKPHHYQITVFAVDVDKLPDAKNDMASAALVGFDLHFHTLAKATLTGLYGR